MAQATLIYLHGFLSSGGSAKAGQLASYLAAERPDICYERPTLPDTPREAWAAVCDCIDGRLSHGPVGLIGSSLGGFWATCAADHFSLPAVVVNPAVHPQLLLQHFLGEQTNPYTGQRFTLVADHMQVLAGLDRVTPAHPERLWLLQQSGDEVLDYRVAIDYYRASRVTLEAGGNHAFTGFERHCPEIVRFLQL